MRLLAAALKVRSEMAASETGSPAWPGSRSGSGSSVSVLVAVAIVVADMVGVGVFTSLGFQVKDIPSGFSILLLWTIGGIVALCGVFSYGELGAMFPRSSGEYNFLGRAYHPAFGFVAGWVSATVGFAAPVALAAMAFGEYGKSVVPNAPPLALAIGVVWLVSLVQLTGVQALLDLSTDRDHPEGGADRGLPGLRLCDRHGAAGVVCAVGFRLHPYRQRAVRDQPRVRDVFVLGLERGDLHHRRGEVARAQRAAGDADRNADRAGAVCRAQRGVPAHRADRQARRPARRRPDFRQLHLRRIRRPHRRRDDLLRADLLDQRDDVDRAARHDDDGRGHSGAAAVRPKVEPAARRPTPSCFSSRSRA